MNIGKLQHKDGAYTGTVQTFTGSSLAVRIALTDLKGVDYLVTSADGETELGVAWNKVGEERGTKYISVKLDSPFLPAPVYCSLFTQKDGSYNLVWTRPDPRKQKKNQTAEQAAA
jgi:uncharacterized protein (DUF736 family)